MTSTSRIQRLGFHYYPDTYHYTARDLHRWLPELHELGATWLTLQAPATHAIPEPFLKGLIRSGINPIIHFHFPLSSPPPVDEMRLFFDLYAEWGVQYVALFDRPNIRSAWPSSAWVQADLVERFLDLFIPLAEGCLSAGLKPIFPPLEPGGDYWDTSFLATALKGIQRRGHLTLLDSIALGAYAWADNHPIDWGKGGPERWPGVRPYHNPTNQEDQCGFYIFDWYLTVAQSVLTEAPPILLLGAGHRMPSRSQTPLTETDLTMHTEKNLAIARLISNRQGDLEEENDDSKMPSQLLACNFWLLAAEEDSPYLHQAWFQPDGTTLPVVDALRQWIASPSDESPASPEFLVTNPPESQRSPSQHHIAHYLLLPVYEWGVVEWHLDAIRPFVLRHHPTVGFSLEEARHAQRVTVIGGEETFPEADLEKLRQAGCEVTRICGDGISIATQMSML